VAPTVPFWVSNLAGASGRVGLTGCSIAVAFAALIGSVSVCVGTASDGLVCGCDASSVRCGSGGRAIWADIMAGSKEPVVVDVAESAGPEVVGLAVLACLRAGGV
jgi:hypothetical protein